MKKKYSNRMVIRVAMVAAVLYTAVRGGCKNGRQAGRQEGRKADWQVERGQAGRQVARQARGPAPRQAGIPASRVRERGSKS